MNDFTQSPLYTTISGQRLHVPSKNLQRTVTVSVIHPGRHYNSAPSFPLLIFQDGQDFEALRLAETIEDLLLKKAISPAIIVGIHANEDRIYEYGTARRPDYMGRGSRAARYTAFVLDELLPYLQTNFRTCETHRTIAGFSLGGLMALDIAWNHPEQFAKAGVFSGSLWWRSKAFSPDYHDSDRIMHETIRETVRKPDLELWFQTGTADETSDRDDDGVIDSISDTLDCIAELERKGFQWNHDVRYLEVENGEHNPATWRKIMPDFLKWALSGK